MSKKSPVKAAAKSAPKSAPAKTVSKPAAKASPPAKTAPVKTAPVKQSKPAPAKEQKPAVPTVQINSRRATKGQPVFVIDDAARPGAGRSLYAHTRAALTVTGLLQPSRPAVAKNSVLTLMGQRAVNYHLKQGNFEDAADRTLRLSSAGFNLFSTRAVDGKLTNAYIDMFLDGKTADTGVVKANLYQATV